MNKGLKIFIVFIAVVVLAAIISGFFIIGSPQMERERLFDQRRVNDLEMIENQLTIFWEDANSFPESLDDIEERLYQEDSLMDPQTNQPYEYERLSQDSYRLCATFTTIGDAEGRSYLKSPYPLYLNRDGQFDQHKAGYECFQRIADAQRYEETKQEMTRTPEYVPPIVY